MPNSPVSEPVVVKPSSLPPSTGGSRPATGPQNRLEKTPYEFNDLRFPPEVGNDAKNIHWIKFIPTIQNKSSYNVKKANQGGREVSSVTDANRLQTGGQLGSSSDSIRNSGGTGAALTAGLAAISGASSLLEGVKDGDPNFLLKAGGSALGGAAAGVLGGFVLSGIDLTRKTRRAAGCISLYMPDTVNQTVVNDYDQVSLTQALGTAGLVSQAGGSIAQSVKDAFSSTDVLTSFGQTAGSKIGAAIGAGIFTSGGGAEIGGLVAEKTGVFGQGITDVLLFSAGYAQNPQVELLFKSIQNREFLFDFKFSPRNETEAKEIIKIIQSFRFFAAPEIPKMGNGRYFIPPSEFDIQFMVGSNPNNNLPKLATCVLQGIDVNYGSAGQWSAFKDGMPVEISLQLRFKEVEIMHKDLVRQGF